MPRRQRDRIVVIADPMADDQDRHRHCYWEDIGHKPKPRVYAIDDHPPARLLYNRTSLLVVSWDSANGDPAFKSDVTLQYLESQARIRIHEMLAEGGTVFAECQTAQGVPVQKAYDAIFGEDELKVTTHVPPEPERRGETAAIAKRYADHPVLMGMPKEVHQNYQSTGERIFYDRFAKRAADSGHIFDNYPRSLWFGWFTSWGRGWIPLLFAELPRSYLRRNGSHGPAPVLIAKVERNGLLLASTLWASGARFHRLIDNVVDLSIEQVRKCHKKILRRRLVGDVLIGASVAAVLVGGLRLLVEVATHPESAGSTWLLSVGGVGFFSVALASWNWYITCVWRRPIGVGVLKATRRRTRLKLINGW